MRANSCAVRPRSGTGAAFSNTRCHGLACCHSFLFMRINTGEHRDTRAHTNNTHINHRCPHWKGWHTPRLPHALPLLCRQAAGGVNLKRSEGVCVAPLRWLVLARLLPSRSQLGHPPPLLLCQVSGGAQRITVTQLTLWGVGRVTAGGGRGHKMARGCKRLSTVPSTATHLRNTHALMHSMTHRTVQGGRERGKEGEGHSPNSPGAIRRRGLAPLGHNGGGV